MLSNESNLSSSNYLNLKDFNFDLPDGLIAQAPLSRAKSRLLYLDSQKDLKDLLFAQLLDCIPENALILFNQAKVFKARLKYFELLLNKDLELFFLEELKGGKYRVLMQSHKKIKIGTLLTLPGEFKLKLVNILSNGERIFEQESKTVTNIYNYLNQYGETPLPPYVKTNNPNQFTDSYQSVFANNMGSVAAPTASLHFSESMMREIKARFKTCFLTLNVGIGTFSPLRESNLKNKTLHVEKYSVSEECSLGIKEAIGENLPIYTVGTTALRALESLHRLENGYASGDYETNIFLTPGDQFLTQGLLTNFHLPQSSLFILIAAFIGLEEAKRVYAHAINKQYRFYSFGDACLFQRKRLNC